MKRPQFFHPGDGQHGRDCTPWRRRNREPRGDRQVAGRGGWPEGNTRGLEVIIVKIADILGVTADYLVGRDEPKKRGSGPVGRARRVLETISRLPRHQQQRIIDVVEALVAQHEQRAE